MAKCSFKPSIEFEDADIREAIAAKRLLSMEVELSLFCNFRCPYCYVPDKTTLSNELSLVEIFSVIDQAHALGARKIILLGGEPMLYPYLFEVIEHIVAGEMEIELFTNGVNITQEIAERLFKYGVNVVLKMNTFDEKKQDELSGYTGAYKIIHAAFDNLLAAGYPAEKPFLAASTIICKQNIDELVTLWKWLRERNILPYFEMITPQGNAKQHDDMHPPLPEVERLFRAIERIDREEYGIEWQAQPPLIGTKCLRHLFSCLVTAQGDIFPCVGVTIPVGNIREQPLAAIISESQVINKLRSYHTNIKGPCGSCEQAQECYGCRGAAYNLTGDYLASDPMCWRNRGREAEIDTLPYPVDDIIPQKNGMRMLDYLDAVGEECATASVTVRPDMLFCDAQGFLDPVAYIEMAAQTVAAMDGFEKRESAAGQLPGYLLGAKKFMIHATAKQGDRIRIEARKQASFGNFNIIEAVLWDQSGVLLAEGEIKIYEVKEGEPLL